MLRIFAETLLQVGLDSAAVAKAEEAVVALAQIVQQFRSQPIDPAATRQFEKDLETQLRQVGRQLVAGAYENLEKDADSHCGYKGRTYKFVKTSPRRDGVDTLFGRVELRRRVYQRVGGWSRETLAPLDHQLGVADRRASPALAERVALHAADASQRETLAWLEREHQVHWSAAALRRTLARVAGDLEPFRLEASTERTLSLLDKANRSGGRRKPVLAVGRDGVSVPSVKGGTKEGAVGTLSVYDRGGRRLGTVYLGRMYEFRQDELSSQLTRLIELVLERWRGPTPRLAYVTDCGRHPTAYHRQVLRRQVHPRTGEKLEWIRVVDFYHASTYVTKIADALFGQGQGRWWARRMCSQLRHAANGVERVLRSAAGYKAQQSDWTAAREKLYVEGCRYLRRRRKHMRYSEYKRLGLPIGSGVTEAACKTVFTQRLKRSGMRWTLEGGQTVTDLRTLSLSGVFEVVYARSLAAKPQPIPVAYEAKAHSYYAKTG